jgi:hypothetical protein
MLALAVALPVPQLCVTEVLKPSFVSDRLSCFTASLSSSRSVSLRSSFCDRSNEVSRIFSVSVRRVLTSSSSTVVPGLSQTWLTGVPRKVSSSKKYWRNRWTIPSGDSVTALTCRVGSKVRNGSRKVSGMVPSRSSTAGASRLAVEDRL